MRPKCGHRQYTSCSNVRGHKRYTEGLVYRRLCLSPSDEKRILGEEKIYEDMDLRSMEEHEVFKELQ